MHSVAALRAPTRPEAERLANLDADAELRPVATDATIGVTWSVAVNDKLGLGAGMATGLGDQRSGDLALTYDLVGIAVRRRARFGDRTAWKPLEESIELPPDFSDPGGVQLGGSFAPQVLNKTWDVDVRVAGEPAPKKLLLNGVAPYEFTTGEPRGRRGARAPPSALAVLPAGVRQGPAGALPHRRLARGRRRRGARGARVLALHRQHQHAALPAPGVDAPGRLRRPAAGTIVAAAEMGQPGVVARADSRRGRGVLPRAPRVAAGARVTLVAFDGAGQEVRRLELAAGTDSHQTVMLGAQGRSAGSSCAPTRRWRSDFSPTLSRLRARAAGSLIEVDEVAYVGLRDYLDVLDRGRCLRRRRARRLRRLRRQRQARVPAQPRVRAEADDARERRAPVDAGRPRPTSRSSSTSGRRACRG